MSLYSWLRFFWSFWGLELSLPEDNVTLDFLEVGLTLIPYSCLEGGEEWSGGVCCTRFLVE